MSILSMPRDPMRTRVFMGTISLRGSGDEHRGAAPTSTWPNDKVVLLSADVVRTYIPAAGSLLHARLWDHARPQ